MREITVGVESLGYKERRNILDVPVPGVRHQRVRSILRPVAFLHQRLPGQPSQMTNYRFLYRYIDLDWNSVDVLHLFFSISYGKRPWVTSLSSWMPRWSKRDRRGMDRLASGSCRQLIAISENARLAQLTAVEQHHPDLVDEISRKLVVLHPPQRALVTAPASHVHQGRLLRVAFVGHQFFRKGGPPLLRAVVRLLSEGAPVHLTIVSSLQAGDFASQAEAGDVDWVRHTIAEHSDGIRHDSHLPNAAVLELLRNSDVAALPTLHDTYGYAVLEAQASGCATITTNVQAMPEINNGSTGWVIDLPLQATGRSMRHGPRGVAALEEIIETGIVAALREALNSPGLLEAKRKAALDRIVSEHEPVVAGQRLRAVYDAALGG